MPDYSRFEKLKRNRDADSSPPGAENRGASRDKGVGFHFLIELDAEHTPTGAHAVALMDISDSGCGLYKVEAVELGTTYGVVLFQAGIWSAHIGAVRHCRKDNGWMRIGIQYESCTDDQKQRLISFAAKSFGFDTSMRRSA